VILIRTFKKIYKEYTAWLVDRIGNEEYSYTNLVERYGEKTAHVFLYKSLLKLFYNKKDGLYYFCKFMIGNLKDIGYPSDFRFNKLLREWNTLSTAHKMLCIEAARGHGKTVFFSQIMSIYTMFLSRFKRIILISSNQEQSNDILENIKLIIDNNEWLVTKKDRFKWAATRIGYNKGYIIAAGISTEILGQHVDRIVLDDILRSDNQISDQQIEDYLDMNLLPMVLSRNGQIILVGTPKGANDIFARIQNRIKEEPQSLWEFFKFKAILDYDTKTLQCPDRFTWKQIMDKRLTMGALKFSREYQLEFFSREQSLFPEKIRQPAMNKGKDIRLLSKMDNRGEEWMYVMGVDVARSGSASADYTVAIVLAYNSVTQAKQIVYIWRAKGFKITNQAAEIAKIARNFDNCQVLVEQNNMGQDMIDELADEWNVGVESFITGGRGQKKEELIRYLITAFEREQIIIPQGDEWTREQMSVLDDELSKFCVTSTPAGNEQFKGLSGHDDTVISLALANKATQIMGVPFAVTNFGKQGSGTTRYTNPMGNFLSHDDDETDLVRMIRMGIIK